MLTAVLWFILLTYHAQFLLVILSSLKITYKMTQPRAIKGILLPFIFINQGKKKSRG